MLKTFKNCPYKYWFKYVEKLSVPQKASLFEKGKKIHALANYYLKGEDIKKLEKTLTYEEQKIWENLKNNEYFQKKYINSEYNLSCKVGDFWIGGRIDAIMKDETKYYILDYKTGSVPENPEYDFQTIVYLLCLANYIQNFRFQEELNFVYINLKNNQNYVINLTHEKISEYKQAILKVCDEINNFTMPETIEHSKKCEFCEYRKICI